jgi:hypothetical protein
MTRGLLDRAPSPDLARPILPPDDASFVIEARHTFD